MKFKGNWSDKEDLISSFDMTDDEKKELESLEILYASYDGGGYEGDALVFLKDSEGKLYEARGSHCSCYGLEGQWATVETNLEALKARDWSYSLSGHEGLRDFLNDLGVPA